MAGKKPKKWMQELNIKEGSFRAKAKKAGAISKKTGNIKESFVEKEEHSKNPRTKKQAVLAETFRKAKKK
jgi:hypothetical protein